MTSLISATKLAALCSFLVAVNSMGCSSDSPPASSGGGGAGASTGQTGGAAATQAGAGGATVPQAGSGGTDASQAGSGGTGAFGGAGAGAGQANSGGGAASAGQAGTGGAGAGGAGVSGAVAQNCAAICTQQQPLQDCLDTTCQADCVAPADASNSAIKCQAAYTAMLACEAPLQANQWTCATDQVAIPVPGQCASSVCAYACCVGSLVADSDIWGRCLSSCPGQ